MSSTPLDEVFIKVCVITQLDGFSLVSHSFYYQSLLDSDSELYTVMFTLDNALVSTHSGLGVDGKTLLKVPCFPFEV